MTERPAIVADLSLLIGGLKVHLFRMSRLIARCDVFDVWDMNASAGLPDSRVS